MLALLVFSLFSLALAQAQLNTPFTLRVVRSGARVQSAPINVVNGVLSISSGSQFVGSDTGSGIALADGSGFLGVGTSGVITIEDSADPDFGMGDDNFLTYSKGSVQGFTAVTNDDGTITVFVGDIAGQDNTPIALGATFTTGKLVESVTPTEAAAFTPTPASVLNNLPISTAAEATPSLIEPISLTSTQAPTPTLSTPTETPAQTPTGLSTGPETSSLTFVTYTEPAQTAVVTETAPCGCEETELPQVSAQPTELPQVNSAGHFRPAIALAGLGLAVAVAM